MKKIVGATGNCGSWSDIDPAKLPETILRIAVLEKLLSFNVLELLVTLLKCSIWGRK